METDRVTTRFSGDDMGALRREAKATSTTVAEVVRRAVAEHLARQGGASAPPAPAPTAVASPHPTGPAPDPSGVEPAATPPANGPAPSPEPAGPAPDPGGVGPAAAPPENGPAGVPRPPGRLRAALDMLDGPGLAAALAAAAIPLHPGPVWSWPEHANVLPDDGPEGGPRRQGRIAAALARLRIGHQKR